MKTMRMFLVGVLVLVVAPASLAQDAKKPVKESAQDMSKLGDTPPVGHHEQPRDQYVKPAHKVTSPGMIVRSRGGYTSVQVNVDENGNNIVGDAANEPSIAVDPSNRNRMVIGWRQFDSISSDFRQAGWGYTSDGGRSWTFPGVIEPGIFRSDPVLDADADGNFYYNSLTTDGGSEYWCHVFKSADGGASWDEGTYAWGGDKQWQTIDQTDGIGRGNIYASWNSFYSACSGHFTRSTDNGQSFESCTSAPGSPYWGTLAVGPDGELYLSGQGFTVCKSTTAQNAALPMSWDYCTSVDLNGSVQFSAGPNPAGLLGQVWVDVDRSSGRSRGNVYMLCSVDPSGSDPLDVMFARSTDGGETWSSPIRVNDDSTTNGAWQWFGTMSVAPNGRIDVVWLDTRNDSGGYDSQLYYAYSEDGGLTFSANEALSPSFDPELGWPQQNKMGDYFDMISDDLGADLAYAATFNGEQDVYYIRIGDSCLDAGRVMLDQETVACEGEIEIAVNDCGLNTDDDVIETVDVVVASDTEPGGETITLTEINPVAAHFVGTVAVSPTDGDGVLAVAEGDSVTITYIDADDGEGGTDVPVIGAVLVDCTGPVITNVQVPTVEPRSAVVTFDVDEPARGTVHYGLSCDALDETATGNLMDTPTVNITGLQDNTTYYFMVEAADEAGNATGDPQCYTFSTPEVPDFFTELFDDSAFDLDHMSLEFSPNDSVDFYRGCFLGEITSLPTDPAGGTAVSLGDDASTEISITGGNTVSLYGVSYSSFYICSNGYITFGTSDTTYSETLEDHFSLPRIAGIFDDFNPSSGGTVSYEQLADRMVVTWDGIPEYSESNSNTFQVEMYFDGTIVLSYLDVAVVDGLVGLSEGEGLDPDYFESDLSSTLGCDPRPPYAAGGEVLTDVNEPVDIELLASDDGLPDPPAALTYTIVSLPEHGDLSDPDGGVIDAVPYTLIAGNMVNYAPDYAYTGPDAFTFMANDGGTPPDGGDSNVATISITVGGPQPVHVFMLDEDPDWSVEGEWAFGVPTGGGSHNYDPTSGYTGDNVYGYNLAGDYENEIPEYALTTTAIDCSDMTGVELRFWRWLGVESATWDHANVQVSNDGTTWTMVWEHTDSSISDTSWSQQVFDISGVADNAATVYVRWVMGETDASVTYPGWNIDDIELWGVVPFEVATGDLNCDGYVNFDDINPFVTAMVGQAEYEAEYPDCNWLNGDTDNNGTVNFDDIDGFVELLAGK